MERSKFERPEYLPKDEPTSANEPLSAQSRNWVDDLIAMTRPGYEMEVAPDVITPETPPFRFDDFD